MMIKFLLKVKRTKVQNYGTPLVPFYTLYLSCHTPNLIEIIPIMTAFVLKMETETLKIDEPDLKAGQEGFHKNIFHGGYKTWQIDQTKFASVNNPLVAPSFLI